MLLRIYSDLHMDPAYFDPFIMPETNRDHETVLIIAGDAAEQRNAVDWIHAATQRFKHVIYVMGNHEYYGGNIKRTPEKIIEAFQDRYGSVPTNFNLLDSDTVEIDDVVFIGATLWTDFSKGNHLLMYQARGSMNDYRKIRHGSPAAPWAHKLTPQVVYEIHNAHKRYIVDQVEKFQDRKLVVVTHHAPSELSIAPKYKGHHLNHLYYSDLSDILVDYDINLWVHGHIHHHVDYTIGGTRVVANPRGYISTKFHMAEETDFDELFTVEI